MLVPSGEGKGCLAVVSLCIDVRATHEEVCCDKGIPSHGCQHQRCVTLKGFEIWIGPGGQEDPNHIIEPAIGCEHKRSDAERVLALHLSHRRPPAHATAVELPVNTGRARTLRFLTNYSRDMSPSAQVGPRPPVKEQPHNVDTLVLHGSYQRCRVPRFQWVIELDREIRVADLI